MSEIEFDAELLPPELPDEDELNDILSGDISASGDTEIDTDDVFTAEELLGGISTSAIRVVQSAPIGSASVGSMGNFAPESQAQVREVGSYRVGPRPAGVGRSESPLLEVGAAFENEDGSKRYTTNYESFLRLEEAVKQARKALDLLAEKGLEPKKFGTVLSFHMVASDPGPLGNRPTWKLLYRGVGISGEIPSQPIGSEVARRQTPPGFTGGVSQTSAPAAREKTTVEDLFGFKPVEDDDPFRGV